MTSSTIKPVPEVLDAGRRTLRTIIQVGIPAFIALAGIVPVLLADAKIALPANACAWLVGVAAIITATAGVLARVMALPSVNTLLAKVGLGGHSGNYAAALPATDLAQTAIVDRVDATARAVTTTATTVLQAIRAAEAAASSDAVTTNTSAATVTTPAATAAPATEAGTTVTVVAK